MIQGINNQLYNNSPDLIYSINLWCRHDYYSHFKEEETEALHKKEVTEPGSEPKQFSSRTQGGILWCDYPFPT